MHPHSSLKKHASSDWKNSFPAVIIERTTGRHGGLCQRAWCGRFGQSQATIEEGAAVRERQTILRLPDLDQMQVKVNVHESKVDQVRTPACQLALRILNKEYTGVVTGIANQPEPTSFFSGNVKEYATYVRINNEEEER